jgi:fatty acid CoA ligase FadD9
VDWLIEAGHPIHRIEDYDEWVSRFETAMRGLPEKQRQESVLTVLDAYRHPAEVIAGSAIPPKDSGPPCVRSATAFLTCRRC